MPDQLQLRGGTTAQHASFTGASKEITVDTTKKTVVVHDGSTAGGNPVMREDGANSSLALGSASSPSLKWGSNSGLYAPSLGSVAISANGTGRFFINSIGNTEIISSGSIPLQVSASLPRIRSNDSDGTNLTADFYTSNGNAFIDSRNDANNGPIIFRGLGGGVASEYFRITPDGRLGLGTSSPATLLHLSSATGSATPTPTELRIATTTGASDYSTTNPWGRISFFNGDTSAAGPKIHAAIDVTAFSSVGGTSDINFLTNSNTENTLSNRLTIKGNTGNVGIGTTSPANLLHIQGDSTFDQNTGGQLAIRGSTNTNNRLNIGFDTTGNYAWLQAITSGTSHRNFCINPAGGNVGIGTDSPTTVLAVQRNGSGTFITLASGDSTTAGDRDVTIAATKPSVARHNLILDAHQLYFNLNGSERARIDSSGRLLVGTSSQSGGSLLQVNDNRIRIATAKTPASATDTGVAGEICWDANYVYVCTATNTWKRTAISTW
jgi:hypothetical protein